MGRAKKKAYQAYPIRMQYYPNDSIARSELMYDVNSHDRDVYLKAYEEAEASTIRRVVRWLKSNHVHYPNEIIPTDVLINNFKREIKYETKN